MQYSSENLVRLAKRDRNTVRPYLYVNPLQGKHIPVSPAEALGMCRALADRIAEQYPGERFYVIGFAETATGVAAGVSLYLKNAVCYQNTTRERVPGADCLFFTESHSHATDQLLRVEGIAERIGEADRVLLVDDEVTTGNTMCKLMAVLRERFSVDRLRFSIVSVLNSMTEDRLAALAAQGIDCVYLARLPHEYRKNSILDVPFEPDRHTVITDPGTGPAPDLVYRNPVNPRGMVSFPVYLAAVRGFAEAVAGALGDMPRNTDVLLLGTEEFMFPSFVLGDLLLSRGLAARVRMHASTRSPIIASGREGYPLFRRWQFPSPYDPARKTFLYNLARCGRVVILTDAPSGTAGLGGLLRAAESAGSRNVTVALWQYREEGQ